MRCIIVDDEPLAHELLSDYVSKLDALELVGNYTNPIEAFASIERDKIELIFLDIQMPELTGIQFLKLLGNKAKVILTTAYSEYALESYDLNVVDYLLKPFSFDRFKRAVEKVMHSTTSAYEIKLDQNTLEHIFVRTEHKIVRICIADILYVEGLKDYISIYTKDERVLTLMSLAKIQELLPVLNFVRVHKSYIVAMDKIGSIEKNRIYIESNGIPIGDTYKDEFYARLEGK